MHDREELLLKLKEKEIPQHVGIIMDGNGRWAQERGMIRTMGHRAGVERLRSVLRFSDDLGVKALSVYAFSSENWKRPEWEINALMKLLTEFMYKEIDELDREGVKIVFMGETEALPKSAKNALDEASKRTRNNDGIVFNVALNYGARAEIARAARLAAVDIQNGKFKAEDLNEIKLAEYMYTTEIPEMDLLIRTSGEERLSNFMLWQCAYTEFVFCSEYWPDFDDCAYFAAIEKYQSRKRRYGGL